MLSLILKGGPVMWPIVGLALLAFAILIERALYFFITGIDYDIFKDKIINPLAAASRHDMNWFKRHMDSIIENSIKGNDWLSRLKRIIVRTRWQRNPYTRMVEAYFTNMNINQKVRDEILKRVGSQEIEKMENHLTGLTAVAHIEPLLGLLGTVTGIITAFSVISRLGGQIDVAALAGGIWEALITTAAGLMVAIPAQLGYVFFEKIVSSRTIRMGYIVTYVNQMRWEFDESGHQIAISEDDPSVDKEDEGLLPLHTNNEEVC